MKKTHVFVFSMVLLLMLSIVGTAAAYNVAYTHTMYQNDVSQVPTIDGTYIVDDDWICSGKEEFGTGAAFHDQWIMDPNLYCLIVEVTDATDDSGDKLTICFDSTEAGGATEPDGGASPTEFDKKLEITGHGGSETVEWFIGDGSGWVTATASAELMDFAQSLTSTPTIAADHYVYEMNFLKIDDASLGSPLVGYTWAEFVSYYDEDAGTTQQWPPADATPAGSPDVPDSWGYITYESNRNPEVTIPDGISIITLMIVSSAAAAGAIVFRRRTK
jgi:hypothetical protein